MLVLPEVVQHNFLGMLDVSDDRDHVEYGGYDGADEQCDNNAEQPDQDIYYQQSEVQNSEIEVRKIMPAGDAIHHAADLGVSEKHRSYKALPANCTEERADSEET